MELNEKKEMVPAPEEGVQELNEGSPEIEQPPVQKLDTNYKKINQKNITSDIEVHFSSLIGKFLHMTETNKHVPGDFTYTGPIQCCLSLKLPKCNISAEHFTWHLTLSEPLR